MQARQALVQLAQRFGELAVERVGVERLPDRRRGVGRDVDAALQLGDLVAHFVVDGVALDERPERASALLDLVQCDLDQVHLLLELRDIQALHQVSRAFVLEFAAPHEVLGAFSAGHIDEFIADDGIGSGVGGGIVGDAGQAVVLDDHSDLDHPIGLT